MSLARKDIVLFLLRFVMIAAATCVQAQDVNCKQVKNKKAIRAYDEALLKFQVRLYGHSLSKLKEALALEPNYIEANFLFGYIYIQKNNVNSKVAKKYFSKVIELCPEHNVYTYYYLADIYFDEGKFGKASEYYTEFLKDVDKIKTDEDYYRATELQEYSLFLKEMYANPVPFDPIPVHGVSTKEDEYLPIISPDNELAFFTRKTEVTTSNKPWQHGKVYKEKFILSYKDGTGFSSGKELPKPFNVEQNEGGATLTIDNNHLYYTVCKFVELDSGTYYNCDIYVSDYINGEWTPIRNLGNNVNKNNTWESQPTISSDGKVLFFTSDRPGGQGGYDLYKSEKDGNGNWKPAKNLGEIINSKGNEKSPFIHTDSQTLYFSSDGKMGLGGYDIFYSKLKEGGKWREPENLGYPINTNADEISFFVSTDGKLGYFASNNYNGPGGWDLYSFELYEEVRPEKVLFLKGEIKNDMDEVVKGAKVVLKNVETKDIEEIEVDSASGKYVIAKQFKNDFIISVKKDGYAQKSKYISKEDSVFQMPKKVEMDVQKLEVGKAYTIDDIFFATDSDQLTEDSKFVLDEFVVFLKDNPTINFEINGHTDNVGNASYNLELSKRRALSVAKYLSVKGISSQRMSSKGFGEEKPLTTNSTPEGRAKNRRTEFLILSY